MKKINQLTVVINTKNSSVTLERTLKSVQFAHEIVVVDMQSTDNTVEIVKKYTKKIISVPDVGFVEPARRAGIEQADTDWILVVDADEEIPPTLSDYIEGKITKPTAQIYDIARKNIVFGAWFKDAGWWPDYQRRLFIKDSLEFSDKIHSVPKAKGSVEKFPAEETLAILHHNYQTIEQYIDRLNRYTTVEANQLRYLATTNAKIIESGFFELFRRFFKESGHQAGTRGLAVTLLQMFYQTATQLKIWQSDGFKQLPDNFAATFQNLISDMHYWHAHYRIKNTKNPIKKLYWLVRKRLRI